LLLLPRILRESASFARNPALNELAMSLRQETSMTKYRPYSRRQLRRMRWAWTKRNLRPLMVLAAGMLASLAIATILLVVTPASPTAFSWYLLGAIHFGMFATCVHALDATFMAHNREAIFHLRGAWGEENTRDELRRAKRKRLIWGSVDSISFEVGDLDHLVVTRRAGLVAIDSKFSNQAATRDTFDMARAAHRARLRAEALAKTLLRNESDARHRSRTNPLAVTPVVVVWGALQHEIPAGAKVNGIEFVPGRLLVRGLELLEGQAVDRDAGEEILNRLHSFRDTASQRSGIGVH
jgi:hypothetical protein